VGQELVVGQAVVAAVLAADEDVGADVVDRVGMAEAFELPGHRVEAGAGGGDLVGGQVVAGQVGGAVGARGALDPARFEPALVAAPGPLGVELDRGFLDGVDEFGGGQLRRAG
jgi:hypothetical protein